MGIGKRAHVLVACALAVVLTALVALGGPGDQVVVAAGDTSDPVARRASEELSALGFDVVDAVVDEAESAPAVATSRDHARAVVRVRDDGVEVWIVDPKTHAATLRETIATKGKKAPSANQAALRAVEIVRAELLPAPVVPPSASTSASASTPPSAAPSAPVVRPSARRRASVTLFAGAGAVPSLEPIARLGGALAASFRAGGAMWIDAFVALPFESDRWSTPLGSGRSRTLALFARARVELGPRDDVRAPLRVSFGVGFGALASRVTGDAAAPYSATTEVATTPAFTLSSTLFAHLAGPLELSVDASMHAALRARVVRIVDEEVAHTGRLSFALVLGPALRF